MDRDIENKGKDTDGVLEKEKDDNQKEKGKEGSRSFMGNVRRISLIPLVWLEDIRRRRAVEAVFLVLEVVVVLLRISPQYRLHYLLL